jgi:hypothetical protein
MRLLALLAVVTAVGGGCGNKDRQKRAEDAGSAVVVVTAPVLSDAGNSATTDEVEPNDTEDVATPLTLGGSVRGRIEPETDVDHYRIEITEAGALALELTAVEGVDLVLELEDAGGTLIARSDRGAARIKEGLPNAAVAPGRYLAVVKSKKVVVPVKKGARRKKGATVDAGVATGPAPVYEITAKLAAPVANAEREPNDDRGTAHDLIVGDTVTGFVGWAGDADVWKLSVEMLSEKNAIDVDISAVEGVVLSAEIADGIGQPLAVRKGPRGGPLALRGLVPAVPEGAPPFHYLTIRGDKSNHETAYQLRVAAKVPGPDAELEPNDALDKAMPVLADRTVVHATWTPGDVDCFVLAADPAVRTIEVTIDTPNEADLSVELLVDGKIIAKSEHVGKGAAERVTGPIPAGAQPVVRVRGTDASAEGAYDVQISEGPAAPPKGEPSP